MRYRIFAGLMAAASFAIFSGGPWSISPAPAAAQSVAAGPSGDSVYHLGSGDKIRIIVFGEDSLGGQFQIGSSGSVALPLIGEIPAQGKTPTELQDMIAGALGQGYLLSPRVSVEVVNYRPFYILGEVNKPGEYPYSQGLTVLKAVAQAQGFTYRANKRKVVIRRLDDAVERETPLTAYMPVAPGDTIRITERWF